MQRCRRGFLFSRDVTKYCLKYRIFVQLLVWQIDLWALSRATMSRSDDTGRRLKGPMSSTSMLLMTRSGSTPQSHETIRILRWDFEKLHTGKAAKQWAVFSNMVLVIGPPDETTARDVIRILSYGKASGAVLAPSTIESQCRTQAGIDSLRRLDYIHFVGAALTASTAQHLVGHCNLQPGMGSTEAGAYFIIICNEDDWEYYHFRPPMGVEHEQRTPELFELVFRRSAELARWQQVFHLYPDENMIRTKDLWTKHPLKPDLWRYAARADDLIVFSAWRRSISVRDGDRDHETSKSEDCRSPIC